MQPQGAKPYPSEHACRLRDPSDFTDLWSKPGKIDGKPVRNIIGNLKRGKTGSNRQTIRFPVDAWTEAAADAACTKRDGAFHAAAKDLGAEEINPMPDAQSAPYSRVLTVPWELKALEDEGDRIVEGWASKPEVDETKEVVLPEAFERGLDKFMMHPLYTYCHDWRDPIGKVIKTEVGDEGVYTASRLMREGTHPMADQVYEWVEQGIVQAQSIGFDKFGDNEKEWGALDEDTGIWYWKAIQWRELAAVPLPALYSTTLQIAKSLGLDLALPVIEQEEEEDPEEAAIRKAQTEEERFVDDLQRLKGGAESAHNIVVHWAKDGRAPSAEYLETMTTARDTLNAILQPDADAREGEAPLALVVPEKPRIAVPL